MTFEEFNKAIKKLYPYNFYKITISSIDTDRGREYWVIVEIHIEAVRYTFKNELQQTYTDLGEAFTEVLKKVKEFYRVNKSKR